MSTRTRSATCTCQQLSVECSGDPELVSLCHCQDCQRRTGSAFGIAAFFRRDKVRVAGKTSCFSRTSDNGFDFSFYFCPNCGGTVYWETTRKPGMVAVAAGAFADRDFPAPTQSVFEESRAPWLHLSL